MPSTAADPVEAGVAAATAVTRRRVADALKVARATARKERRAISKARKTQAVVEQRTALTAAVADAAQDLKDGKTDPDGFVSAATTAISAGLIAAYTAGALAYNTDFSAQGVEDAISDRLATVTGFLSDWADVLGLSKDDPNAQSDEGTLAQASLYGDAAGPAYEQGFGDGVTEDTPDAVITWNSEDDACPLCLDRNGETYSADTLPGYPGDGSFGELCDGGPNCRCNIEYSAPDGSSIFDNQDVS